MAQQRQDSFRSRNADIYANGTPSKFRVVMSYFLGLLAVTLVLSAVCFMGNDYMNVQFIPGNSSKSKIIAEVPFEFESKVKTQKLYEQKKRQACNVYTIDESKYDGFIKKLKLLDERLESFSYENVLSEQGRNDIRELVNEFNSAGPIKLEWQDVALIVISLGQIERTQIFQECVSILREIAKDGVYFDDLFTPQPGESFVGLCGFKVRGRQQQHVRTQEEAFHHARTHILSLELDKDIATIFFKVLKQGIRPNLVYDAEGSKLDERLIARSIRPIVVKHDVGDVILEQNTMIDGEVYETFVEHQRALRTNHTNRHMSYYVFFTRALLAFITIAVSFIGLTLFPQKSNISQKKRYFILSAIMLLQVTILRAYIQFGELEIFVKNSTFIYALYCAAPFLIAPAVGTLLLGIADGLASAIVVSILHTLMLARPTDFCLVVLFTCLAFVRLLREASSRSKVFACSLCAGLIFAGLIMIHGILTQLASNIVMAQMVSTFAMSVTSGVVIVLSLPFFEKIFSICTDISLLKLTDYKNPLLQRLQFAAPGTYQHSLIVSILSEQVAHSIKADKIICKTAALFHDLGKIAKPEYFIENQNNHVNPHDKQTPYISSLIIRSHVREGVVLASIAKLPKIIIDAIMEHHGTTTTQFFYDRARGDLLSEIDVVNATSKDIDKYLRDKLDKNSFRYDGPRPRSKESAIIMLADSIEAASRSLKKVTHQNIESLIEEIFLKKTSDHQLDECSITLDELKSLKRAFTFTLVHMLHSRINSSKMPDEA
ncbi:MAG: HDIG domain-containing protein [Puniceicoccales bacterium]|jgi:putative nucleotidyltransferase with HDIG domain|nr:HDIG domain-containing protein [Puniceicoccales bacterium]